MDASSKYEVGQIVYVVALGNTITPMQIIEENCATTLNGKTFSYAVQAGPDDEIKKLKPEWECFPDAATARSELKNRAAKAIDRMIDSAEATARSKWPMTTSSAAAPQRRPADELVTVPPDVGGTLASNETLLEVGGRLVKVKLPGDPKQG